MSCLDILLQGQFIDKCLEPQLGRATYKSKKITFYYCLIQRDANTASIYSVIIQCKSILTPRHQAGDRTKLRNLRLQGKPSEKKSSMTSPPHHIR